MKFPKLVIASDGETTAALLDGKMIGRGVGKIEMVAEGAAVTLNITGIDVATCKLQSEADFIDLFGKLTE